LKPYSEFINLIQAKPLDKPNIVMTFNRLTPLLRFLNVKYWVVERGARIDAPEFEPVFSSDHYQVYQDHRAMPRSFIVHQAQTIKGRNATFRALIDPAFNPAVTAIVDEPIPNLPGDSNLQSAPPRLIDRSLNRVVLETQTSARGLLVLADAYYPGWNAFIDGEESHLYRVNYILRGVSLPAGQHRVEFRYQPLSFTYGAWISLASLLLLSALWFWLSRRLGGQRRSEN
jgi:uncharacterized membrane protein YfhO